MDVSNKTDDLSQQILINPEDSELARICKELATERGVEVTSVDPSSIYVPPESKSRKTPELAKRLYNGVFTYVGMREASENEIASHGENDSYKFLCLVNCGSRETGILSVKKKGMFNVHLLYGMGGSNRLCFEWNMGTGDGILAWNSMPIFIDMLDGVKPLFEERHVIERYGTEMGVLSSGHQNYEIGLTPKVIKKALGDILDYKR